MKKLFFILICLTALVACSPRVVEVVSYRDTTITKIQDRFIYDTIRFEVEKEVEKVIVRDSVSHLENSYAISDAEIDDMGFLHHSLSTKPRTVEKPIKVMVHDTTKVYIHEKAETVEVPRELTKWQRTKMEGFWILLSVVAAAVAWKVYKLFK